VTSPEAQPSLAATLRRLFRVENRRQVIRKGRIERVEDFSRPVAVYLPAGYDEREERRYPVLYMQDGQNLFDAERAYIPGQHWRLREAADAAISERKVLPVIIVGIDHAGTARIDEYTPTKDPRFKGSGRADEYARLLLEQLKPLIDARFRTKPEDTAVGGSSLGGLVSIHLALKHPDVFSRAAILSPSGGGTSAPSSAKSTRSADRVRGSGSTSADARERKRSPAPARCAIALRRTAGTIDRCATTKTGAAITASARGRGACAWRWSFCSLRRSFLTPCATVSTARCAISASPSRTAATSAVRTVCRRRSSVRSSRFCIAKTC